jgi:hypothetical protein
MKIEGFSGLLDFFELAAGKGIKSILFDVGSIDKDRSNFF